MMSTPDEGNGGDRLPATTVEEIDAARQQKIAYEYLCHLEEAKKWIEACIREELPPTTVLEENLRNGVYLAKLSHFFAPSVVALNKIYDLDQSRYLTYSLQFKHTENIYKWLQALKHIGLPLIFHPETTDIYDKKNMPRVIYCIHALSLYLFRLGKAPQIQDLYGKVNFTEEEINSMTTELQKYGIRMPQFCKIGGILARDLPVDEAALHAAIIAINNAIDQKIASDTFQALQNQSAHLKNIDGAFQDRYQEVLFESKDNKAQNALNRSLDADYVPDAYDELLTQAEIQGLVNSVNVLCAVKHVAKYAHMKDLKNLIATLQSSYLNLKYVKPENAKLYVEGLAEMSSKSNQNNNIDSTLKKETIQELILACNSVADRNAKCEEAVTAVNDALGKNLPLKTFSALQMLCTERNNLCDFASPLYHEEMGIIRQDLGRDLTLEEIKSGVKVLSAISTITAAVQSGDADRTWIALHITDAHIACLDQDCKQKYFHALRAFQKHKVSSGLPCSLLTHLDIQDCIDLVNMQYLESNDQIAAMQEINKAVVSGDENSTLESLRLPAVRLQGISSKDSHHYLELLQARLHKKRLETNDCDAKLWLEDVQEIVKLARDNALQVEKACASLAAINMGIDQGDCDYVMSCLQTSELRLGTISAKLKKEYMVKLTQTKESKMLQASSPWVLHKLYGKYDVFCNLETLDYSWETPDDYCSEGKFLNVDDIQSVTSLVSDLYQRKKQDIAQEKLIIKLQARIRGYLVRKKVQERRNYFHLHVQSIIKLQAWCRGHLARKVFRKVLTDQRAKQKRAQQPETMEEKMEYYKKHVNKICKIQALWRSRRDNILSLLHSDCPPLETVRKSIHLLDISDQDFEEEMAMQTLKSEVVQALRHNQRLEKDLDGMDIKIGLLVKNRITLQDVMVSGVSLSEANKDSKTKNKEISRTGTLSKGLRGLTKSSREQLESYQHLFYLLQTQPKYLAKLLFVLPPGRTTKFLESVVLTLFNYGANSREEYLLLKLFETSLEEEIRCKVDKVSDIICGNPLIIKLIVNFNRNERGQSSLQSMLGPLIRRVLNDRGLHISTNPVEVYKTWINQTETQTGQPSTLPYVVSQEEALKHEEVQERLNLAILSLKQWTKRFLNKIMQSRDCIPYGMLYMAKVLLRSLQEKFPVTPEKDILKAVGHLIYYRFINSAIVAPDAFDIVSISADQILNNDQRRNLGSIAKILQFAASKKGFGEESLHLMCLNPFIIECHEKFKLFFRHCCDVEEPEERFNMNQYSEAALIAKPSAYMSLQEICDTHSLLMENEDLIAPDAEDPLHELLADLGGKPSVGALIGNPDAPEETLTVVAKSEVYLTLCNKFEVPVEDKSESDKLFVKTKQMLVAVLPCTSGDSIAETLSSHTTTAQEHHFCHLQGKREMQDKKAQMNKSIMSRTNSFLDNKITLEGLKAKVANNLRSLELAGYVSRHDGYQQIITSLGKSISSSSSYRQMRRLEIQKLKATKQTLGTKRKFYEDQREYYNQYLKTCLDNLNAGKKKVHLQKTENGKPKAAVKYSAAKLHEKGVLLEIEGLPPGQFKNVLFEIVPTQMNGVFEVNAKFLGVPMEQVQLNIQDLLQLQFDGVSVMNMFGKAKINVNLLLFLLNRKFYGKSK